MSEIILTPQEYMINCFFRHDFAKFWRFDKNKAMVKRLKKTGKTKNYYGI